MTLYGLWSLGATAVGLHTASTIAELEKRATAADIDALVYDPSYEDAVEELPCPTISTETVAELSNSRERSTGSPEDVATWHPDDTALILFTSGTTGDPKGVRLTMENLLASASASAYRLGIQDGDRWLCCLPVSHMGGLAPAVRTVCYGTTLVVQRAFKANATATTLDEYDITHVSLVPTQLKRLLDTGWKPNASLSTVLLGGAPAAEALLERCDEAGVPAYPTYGMTEAASQITTARPPEHRAYPGTVGSPLVCTDVTIVDDGESVEPGQRGEIVIDGPTVTPGYLDSERTAAPFSEHGFQTGDVGYRDEDGRLWVMGRRDDVILTGGELVAPAGIQDTLCQHDAVANAVVLGVPDEEWGERVVAAVGSTGPVSTETLREFCEARLASYKVPKTIEFVDDFPRTQSGTVDRDALLDRFLG
jgi:O-succinylbenzoic acid--CoA ligase